MQDLEPDAFMPLSSSASCMKRVRVVTGDALLYSSLLCRQDTYSDSMSRRNASLNLKRRNGGARGSHLYPTRLEPLCLLSRIESLCSNTVVTSEHWYALLHRRGSITAASGLWVVIVILELGSRESTAGRVTINYRKLIDNIVASHTLPYQHRRTGRK
jgi:hypothetical protein